MKFITLAAVAIMATAPVANAQYRHTGRYYGPKGSYTKCDVIGGRYNSSVFCKSGAAARDEDRRLDAKNVCTKKVKAAWDANNPQAFERATREWEQENPMFVERGWEPSEISINSAVSLMRWEDPAYKANISNCFTANGFGG